MVFRKAILIIHGFAGGTYDQEDLANYLELNKEFDVFQFTLSGHKKNLSRVKYMDWINDSEEKIKWLISKGYKKIYLIGHSMGGVIATYLASKHKEVKKLVLAAPAFQYLQVIKDQLHLSESLKTTPKLIKTYGSDEIISRFLKLKPSAIREFMTLIKKYYDYPKDVYCKTLILQGKNDNLVPLTSSEYVYNTIKSDKKALIYIEKATHDIFYAKNKLEIFKIVEEFLKNKNIEGIGNI